MRFPAVIAPLVLLAACATPVPPAPPPPIVQAPPPRPAPAPVPASSDWRDWPLTPGDWIYRKNGYSTEAVFGLNSPNAFSISCDNDRKIRLQFPVVVGGPVTVRTSTMFRQLQAGLIGHPPSASAVVLAPNDPLLDAIGFSRGRFVVERPNMPTLVIPAWAEILRVTEDCRG